MANLDDDEEYLDADESSYETIKFSDDVQLAIDEILASDDPLDKPDFNPIDYINTMFPSEQSLSNIDEVLNDIKHKVRLLDNDIRDVVKSDTENAGADGKQALQDAQSSIKDLFERIRDIKDRSEQSEKMVLEITHDIKQLDHAKRNLTTSITTLNHLHMLVGGVQSLQEMTENRQYSEIAHLLQAVLNVLENFTDYMHIKEIKQLADQAKQIQTDLSTQILNDFKEAFEGANSKYGPGNTQRLSHGCLVVDILDSKVKKELLSWFVKLQLSEYMVLFSDNQDCAWIDKVDRRYAWAKRTLVEFEEKYGKLFPVKWELSERICVEFCNVTRKELSSIMAKRVTEIDVGMLLFAIQRTMQFEQLLMKRYSGVTIQDRSVAAPAQLDEVDLKNPFLNDASESIETPHSQPVQPANPFKGIIVRAFEMHLNIFIDSRDRELAASIDRFIQDTKSINFKLGHMTDDIRQLPSAGDLFLYFKEVLKQCSELTDGQPMVLLTRLFQKYLKEYANRVLLAQLPKSNTATNMSTAGMFIQNILKEGQDNVSQKFTDEEQRKICVIISSAEYCMETTKTLEDRIKSRTQPLYFDQITLTAEADTFHGAISQCIQLLVQDLEQACEPALVAMGKKSWNSLDAVGDQSFYISTIINHLKATLPILRDCLIDSRKYYTQLCIKFANVFITKFITTLFKCKPISTVGAEQLLLDTHSLRTVLQDLPSIGSQISRKAPASYTKIVAKGMTRAEMILKIVMSPHEVHRGFVENYMRLLPDSDITEFQKVLEMKGLKRTECGALMEAFKLQAPHNINITQPNQSPEHDTSRIKKLERLIKKRI